MNRSRWARDKIKIRSTWTEVFSTTVEILVLCCIKTSVGSAYGVRRETKMRRANRWRRRREEKKKIKTCGK